MGFGIVCHDCKAFLYEGMGMIPFYQLRNKIDGKCPNCGNRLSLRPLSIHLQNRELTNSP